MTSDLSPLPSQVDGTHDLNQESPTHKYQHEEPRSTGVIHKQYDSTNTATEEPLIKHFFYNEEKVDMYCIACRTSYDHHSENSYFCSECAALVCCKCISDGWHKPHKQVLKGPATIGKIVSASGDF